MKPEIRITYRVISPDGDPDEIHTTSLEEISMHVGYEYGFPDSFWKLSYLTHTREYDDKAEVLSVEVNNLVVYKKP